MISVYVGLLIASAVMGILLTLLGLPGNWLIVAAVAVYAYNVKDAGRADIGIAVAIAVFVLAAIGELLEFAAGAWGASRAGGSRRSATLALVGSVVGGISGSIVGLPIPVIGPLLAAVFFAALGALLGAMAGEIWKGRTLEQGWTVGRAAFHGRLLGILVKLAVALVMVAVIAAALFLE